METRSVGQLVPGAHKPDRSRPLRSLQYFQVTGYLSSIRACAMNVSLSTLAMVSALWGKLITLNLSVLGYVRSNKLAK